MSSNLVLTGFSGTGKSHVGSIVAELTGLEFIDTDERIELMSGKPISDIFNDHGEGHFRDLEKEAIRDACASSNVVISTGGGSVVSSDNWTAMTEGGFVVCLEASAETIVDRMEKTGKAYPMLDGGDKILNIKTLKSARQQYYALANWTIYTDDLEPEDVAMQVISIWRENCP